MSNEKMIQEELHTYVMGWIGGNEYVKEQIDSFNPEDNKCPDCAAQGIDTTGIMVIQDEGFRGEINFDDDGTPTLDVQKPDDWSWDDVNTFLKSRFMNRPPKVWRN